MGQRHILHCDCNCFYASVEMQEHPELRGKSIAVCGDPEARHGIVLTASYPAKRMGVKTAMPIWEAKQHCRDLIVVPASYGKYQKYSSYVREIFRDYTDQVESFGLDEAWLDITGSLGLFGDPVKIAKEISDRIKRELGITVSIGVSFNKITAKLGSAPAGLDVRGGGPASRESELLKPLAAAQVIHAIVLAGGSAFGLDAAGGVMRYLEERGIGFDVGVTKVPLVCQSDLFDLTVADARTRPDAAMAYAACVNAETGNYRDGNHGAGTGATVGKLLGMDHCMKSGIGSYAVQAGDLKVGALVAVNAVGDVYDFETGRKVAGLRADDGKTFLDSERVLMQQLDAPQEKFVGNTTLGILFTNAKLDKARLCKAAGMAHDGYARAIRPVHTSMDGDSIYAVSLGDEAADLDAVGVIGARVMAKAIVRAVEAADSAYGFPAARDL